MSNLKCCACGKEADIKVEDKDGFIRPYCFEHGCDMDSPGMCCQDCPYFAEFCWDVNDPYVKEWR